AKSQGHEPQNHLYKVRTVPAEGDHPERPEPSKPGRGHKYATPVSQRTYAPPEKGQRSIIPEGRRSGLVFFLCSVRDVSTRCRETTGPRQAAATGRISGRHCRGNSPRCIGGTWGGTTRVPASQGFDRDIVPPPIGVCSVLRRTMRAHP